MSIPLTRILVEPRGLVIFSATLVGICTLATGALGQTLSAGTLSIGPAWTRATPPGATTAGGYLTVVNHGTEPDKLVEVEFAADADVVLHSTLKAGDVSGMRLVDAIVAPAGKTTRLEPDGFHIMFTKLKERLRQGQIIPGALVFEHAGRVPVEFRVERVGAVQSTPKY